MIDSSVELIVMRDVEIVTTEFQEVYFTNADLNALFPHHSVNEIKDILQMADHPDYRYVTTTIMNDHHRNIKGILNNLSEVKKTLNATIEIV